MADPEPSTSKRLPTQRWVGIVVLVIVVALTLQWRRALPVHAPANATDAAEYLFSGDTMGTTYHIKVVAPESQMDNQSDAVAAAIQERLDRVIALMSTYEPNSELSRFNAQTDNTPFAVAPETFNVFQIAQQVSAETSGAFDVTVGPLVNAWGFGADGKRSEPTQEDIAALLKRVGYQKLTLDPLTSTVQKQQADLYCDLSSVAEGYAVDLVAEKLDALHLENYMVEIGGEVRTRGKNRANQPWQIGIQKPDEQGLVAGAVVALSGQSLSTSGDYRKFIESPDGRRRSHHINPATGMPVDHVIASASVITDSCAFADAYSTALMILGPDKSMALAEKLNLAIYLIVQSPDKSVHVIMSPQFERYLQPATPAVIQ